MQKVTSHRGTAIALPQSNIDTDQIIPARHCLTTKRSGFAPHLFSRWRLDPDFALNDPDRSEATVLVAGANFGTGSSREHAVWALQDGGFAIVIAPSFGDIFYTNCGRAGLLPIRLAPDSHAQLVDDVLNDPQLQIQVDLLEYSVEWSGRRAPLLVDADLRRRFIEGLDDIDLTLAYDQVIADFEKKHARIPMTRK